MWKCCWGLILRNKPHCSVEEVWDVPKENWWDFVTACRTAGIEKNVVSEALPLGMKMARDIEETFSVSMRKPQQKERWKNLTLKKLQKRRRKTFLCDFPCKPLSGQMDKLQKQESKNGRSLLW